MSKNKPSGVITALVTPFKDGAVDKKSFIQLVQQQLEAGAEGLVINGTTGESPTLKLSEVKQLAEWAKAEVGQQIPIIIGAGLNSTEKTVELIQELNGCKPDYFLTVVPYYNRPPQRGLAAHFKKVADTAGAPIILYNVPSRTVAKLEPETVIELSQHKNICGIKEATGDLNLFRQLKAGLPQEFSLLSGDDATCVDFINEGGDGVISVFSHIVCSELKLAIKNRESNVAEKFSELLKFVYIEANPIPVKMAMYWMKVIDSPELRLPLVELDQKYHEGFKQCLRQIKKL